MVSTHCPSWAGFSIVVSTGSIPSGAACDGEAYGVSEGASEVEASGASELDAVGSSDADVSGVSDVAGSPDPISCAGAQPVKTILRQMTIAITPSINFFIVSSSLKARIFLLSVNSIPAFPTGFNALFLSTLVPCKGNSVGEWHR